MKILFASYARARMLRLAIIIGCAALASGPASASFTGSHDGTTVSATWGWGCDTSNPSKSVTVYFYTYISGVLTNIGSTKANRNRADVGASGACGSSYVYHGFVFTAYPQSIIDGLAHDIYAYIKKTDGTLKLLTSSPKNVSFVPTGLWDPGLINGRWRTDYSSTTLGTSANPLLLDAGVAGATPQCSAWTWPPDFLRGGPSIDGGSECLTAPTSYSQSNAASSDGNFGNPSFWVVSANSEAAYEPTNCPGYPPGLNSGPPDQTDPISAPGAGLYALAILPDTQGGDPSRMKAHIIANKNFDPNATTLCKGAFLSYGVESDQGNGHGVITLLGQPGAKKMLSFNMTLFSINSTPTLLNVAYVFIEAQWGGAKRWAYITLMDRNGVGDNIDADHFNWNIISGLFFPGADIAFKNVDNLNSQCASTPGWVNFAKILPTDTYPNPNAEKSYNIDLAVLFTCLSSHFTAPMPSLSGNYVPITGIHFAVEQGFDLQNWTWIAVDSVKLQ